jgi:hypothetical protein
MESFHAIAEIVFRLEHQRFFYNPSQFISHQPPVILQFDAKYRQCQKKMNDNKNFCDDHDDYLHGSVSRLGYEYLRTADIARNK